MKRILFISIFFLYYSVSFAQFHRRQILKLDLNYQSSNVLTDLSSHQNLGKTYNISYSKDRFGKDCSSAYFDGRTSFISFLDNPSFRLKRNEFTFSVWLKIDSFSDPFQNFLPLICKSSCCENNVMDESQSNPSFRVHSTIRTQSINTQSTFNLDNSFMAKGEWFNYVVTYNGKKINTYYNGLLFNSTPYKGKLLSNQDPLEIGRDLPGRDEYFMGNMDNLVLLNKALKRKKQIVKLYQSSDVEKAPVCKSFTNQVALRNKGYSFVSKKKKIKIYFSDNAQQDGDSVDLILNNQVIAENQLLEAISKNKLKKSGKFVMVELNPGVNKFYVNAKNLGLIPPNTIYIGLAHRRKIVKSFILNSEIGSSDLLEILYQ